MLDDNNLRMKKILFIWLLVFINTLSAWSENIKVGEYTNLNPSITLGYKDNLKSATWNVDKPSVIRLQSNGSSYQRTAYGLAPGSCRVTCNIVINRYLYDHKYKEEQKTYTWNIYVEENKPNSILITPQNIELDINKTAVLSATVSPSDAKTSYTWSMSTLGIVSLSNQASSTTTIQALNVGETIIKVSTDNGKTSTCTVKVYGNNPNSISIPSSKTMTVGDTEKIIATFSPKDHRSNTTWRSSNNSVASITNEGTILALNPGGTDITATTANGKTASMHLTVNEPPFNLQSYSPIQGATNVDVLEIPQITYSLNIKLGGSTSSITLSGGGQDCVITPSCQGNILSINHDKALIPNTSYTLTIPAGTIRNEWDTPFNNPTILNFTTGDLSKLEINPSTTSTFVEEGILISLGTNCPSAKVYYTTDGKEPNDKSIPYTEPIEMKNNFTLWAKAYAEGYEIAEFKHDYKISHVKCIEKYPTGARNELYNYDAVNPYVAYSVEMYEGNNFNNITFNKSNNHNEKVEGEFILSGNKLVFVPTTSLDMGETYVFVIPEGALKDQYDEPNAAIGWKFTTGYFAKKISAGSRQSGLLDTEHTLFRWGKEQLNYAIAYDAKEPWHGVTDFAIGREASYAIIDNSLWTSGEQLCGENGTNSFNYITSPKKVFIPGYRVYAGGQTTAFTSNGGLRMIGRNDMGQINESESTLHLTPKLVNLTNVKEVSPSLTATFALTEDGNLYGWGRNENGWFLTGDETDVSTPQLIMTGIKTFSASKWSSNWVAAITNEGKLYTWGNEPLLMLENVKDVAVGNNTIAAIKNDNTLWMWGENLHGEMGNSVFAEYINTPQQIMTDVKQVDMGDHHIMVIKEDGSVWSWGCNAYAQLGHPSESEPTPFNHIDDSTPKLVMAGRNKCALESIDISQQNIEVVCGEQTVVIAKPNPLNADYSKWNWDSSNDNIVKISDRGVIKAVAEGTATITITSGQGIMAQCSVTVKNTTDIKAVNKDNTPFNIYDLQGRAIRKNSHNINNLPKGIYIVNGKKVQISK